MGVKREGELIKLSSPEKGGLFERGEGVNGGFTVYKNFRRLPSSFILWLLLHLETFIVTREVQMLLDDGQFACLNYGLTLVVSKNSVRISQRFLRHIHQFSSL